MDPRVQIAINLIKKNLHRELTLSSMAQAVGLSPSRLRHLFKIETGVTLRQYLHLQRLQEAKVQIEETFLTMKQVMFLVGLRDESHFTRDFKRYFGITPTQCRHNVHRRVDKSAMVIISKFQDSHSGQ